MRICTALLTLIVPSIAVAQAKRVEPLPQIAQSVGIIGGLCFIVIICLILAAWIGFISALLNRWVQQKIHVISTKGIRVFLLGIVFTLLIIIIGSFCGVASRHFPPAGIIALLSVFTLWSAFILGLVPVSWVIGERIARTMGADLSGLSTAILGAFTLLLICFVPIVGWAFALYWAFVAIGLWVVQA